MATAVTKRSSTSAVSNVGQEQALMVKNYVEEIQTLSKNENVNMTQEQINYCVPILHEFVKKVVETGVDVNRVNTTTFLEQVKHFGRMGLSIQDKEMYLDIRNNGKTGLLDCTLMMQYQGVQKLMTRYCSKKIVRYLDGVVCNGDVFETEIDFDSGLTRIKKHIKNDKVDRNKLINITQAYAIAYCLENNQLVPYASIIDKNRIMRAYNASPSREKTVWAQDSQRMVVKTCYWTLYHSILKPFIEIPSELKVDWEATNNKMEWENAPPITDNGVYDIGAQADVLAEDKIVISNEPIKTADKEETGPAIDLSELPPDEPFEIDYQLYADNKEAYIKLEYNKETKKVLVKRK